MIIASVASAMRMMLVLRAQASNPACCASAIWLRWSVSCWIRARSSVVSSAEGFALRIACSRRDSSCIWRCGSLEGGWNVYTPTPTNAVTIRPRKNEKIVCSWPLRSALAMVPPIRDAPNRGGRT